MTDWQAVAQGGAITLLLTLTASAQEGKIQDRIPPALEETHEQWQERLRKADEKLQRDFEEVKRLEAEGKAPKPYRGLVFPSGGTCRAKKPLTIPPILS
jgi:hypothetical protein